MGTDAEGLLRTILQSLARRTATRRGMGAPLWSVVGDLIGSGSTTATEVCRRYGVDPFACVREPVFVDPACQVVLPCCPKCGGLVSEEGAPCDHGVGR